MIDLNIPLTELKGKPLQDRDGAAATVASCLVEVLFSADPDPARQQDARLKIRKGLLAEKIYREAEALDLTAAEIVLCVECLKAHCSPLALVQCLRALDPAELKIES
jgi:hypothetical protein